MSEQSTIKPTDSELEILNILWGKGPSTVREVHEKLSTTKAAGYTTTLKLMQIMLEKGLVSRDAGSKMHVYTAVIKQEHAQGQMVQRIIATMFNGSAMQLVLQALGNHKVSSEELAMIQAYLDAKRGT